MNTIGNVVVFSSSLEHLHRPACSLPKYETKKPTDGKCYEGLFENRFIIISLKRAQKQLRFKRSQLSERMQQAVEALPAPINIPEGMTMKQFVKLRGASLMTVLYHARYVENNAEEILSKIRGSNRGKMMKFVEAMCYPAK